MITGSVMPPEAVPHELVPLPAPTIIDPATLVSDVGTAYTLPSAAPTNTLPELPSRTGPVSMVCPEVEATCRLVTTGAADPPVVAVPTNTGDTEYSTPLSSPKYSTSLS